MRMIDCDRQAAQRMAEACKAAGYRVFLAKRGTYGFYTDAEGSRVISFQFNGFETRVSGNYITDNPAFCGMGWCIDQDACDLSKLDEYFNAWPPSWAVGRANIVKLCTLEQHLSRYQDSSQYTEQ